MTGTYIITNKKIIVEISDKFKTIALKLTTGTATICGSKISKTFGGGSSSINMAVNEPVVITSGKKNNIDGLIIDALSGTVEVITN